MWWDSAKQSVITNATGGNTWTTNLTYDYNGHELLADINDDKPRDINYVTDVYGQVMTRKMTSGNFTNPRTFHYYFNGKRYGQTTNDGASDTIDPTNSGEQAIGGLEPR